jgi:hypothetical protein
MLNRGVGSPLVSNVFLIYSINLSLVVSQSQISLGSDTLREKSAAPLSYVHISIRPAMELLESRICWADWSGHLDYLRCGADSDSCSPSFLPALWSTPKLGSDTLREKSAAPLSLLSSCSRESSASSAELFDAPAPAPPSRALPEPSLLDSLLPASTPPSPPTPPPTLPLPLFPTPAAANACALPGPK